MAALEVQTVNCVNNGAFVMSFGLEVFNQDILGWTTINDLDQGPYPIDQNQSIDLSTTTISEGTAVRPQVRVRWGDTVSAPTYIRYAKNGQTATWVVTGTTLNVHISQTGV